MNYFMITALAIIKNTKKWHHNCFITREKHKAIPVARFFELSAGNE